MCGRFTSTTPAAELAETFAVTDIKVEQLGFRYNVAPTDKVYAVAERRPAGPDDAPIRQLGAFRWGLVPAWAKDPGIGSRLINARSETIAEKPAYREALLRRRCIVPADAFYEWQARPGSGSGRSRPTKVPHVIRHRDGTPLAFAGLWEVWRAPGEPDGPPVRSCAIVTTEANTAIAPIHDRMPVDLPPSAWDRWLDPGNRDVESTLGLLVPAPPDQFEIYPVSTLVSNVANDGPELIVPALEGERPEVLQDEWAAERLQFG
jgi:putative SOS response-associated peptidase YedK